MDTQAVTKRLDELQKKAELIKQQKSKLEGEAQALQTRLNELEEKVRIEAGVEVKELPNLIKGYETRIENYMKEIEEVLS